MDDMYHSITSRPYIILYNSLILWNITRKKLLNIIKDGISYPERTKCIIFSSDMCIYFRRDESL